MPVATLLLALAGGCGSPTAPPKPPVVGNASAPVIQSIAVPSARVETGQNVAIAAVVEDAETPLTQLAYTWTTNTGVITGAGAAATWSHPAGLTSGRDVTVTLTVTDTYDAVENNRIVQRQFVVSRASASFRVHDSVAETRELARKFLIDLFGNSSVPPDGCLVDFADICADVDHGRNDELGDIIDNREKMVIRQATMLLQRNEWTSTDFGIVRNAVLVDDYFIDGSFKLPTCGDFWLTVVYVNGRWWLCTSRFDKDNTTGCPAAVDNSVAGRTLGDRPGKSVDVFGIIKRRLAIIR